MKCVEYILIFELVLVQSHASHTKDTHYVSKYNSYMYIVIDCNIIRIYKLIFCN